MGVNVHVTMTGPLFQGDFEQRVQASVVKMVRKLIETGNENLANLLRKRPEGVYLEDGQSTGNYRRNVQPEFQQGGLYGLITDGGVVYGPWLEGTSSRNETTRFKGYAAFRRTAETLNAKAGEIVAREAQELAQELNG